VGARDCTHSPAQTTRWPARRLSSIRPSRIESVCMKTLLNARLRAFAASAGQAVLLLTVMSSAVQAQINPGQLTPQPDLPFTMTQVATFKLPWRIAFLPDGRMLITEKVGPIWLVTQQGQKTAVENVPEVLYQGQGGMLGVFVSPHYATDRSVYL